MIMMTKQWLNVCNFREELVVSQQERFAVTALMLNPDTKKDLRFQPLSKQVF